MVEAVSLASGSEGNCLLVGSEKTKILIDIGITWADLSKKLKRLSILPESIKAVFLSHEHNDHSSGIADIYKNLGCSVYASLGTFRKLKVSLSKKAMSQRSLLSHNSVRLGDLRIKPFTIYHDAIEPLGFIIRHKDKKIIYLVDTARITKQEIEEIKNADLVVIDSNYDRLSLIRGIYPEVVKKRIANLGHLSNEIVANIILSHPDDQPTEFWLAHLSRYNNSPSLACITVNSILTEGKKRKRPTFKVLPRKRIGPRWNSRAERQYALALPET